MQFLSHNIIIHLFTQSKKSAAIYVEVLGGFFISSKTFKWIKIILGITLLLPPAV